MGVHAWKGGWEVGGGGGGGGGRSLGLQACSLIWCRSICVHVLMGIASSEIQLLAPYVPVQGDREREGERERERERERCIMTLLLQDVISTVLFTSAYLTLTIPLIVFSRSLSDFERLLPKLDSTVHFDSLKTRYYLNIVS